MRKLALTAYLAYIYGIVLLYWQSLSVSTWSWQIFRSAISEGVLSEIVARGLIYLAMIILAFLFNTSIRYIWLPLLPTVAAGVEFGGVVTMFEGITGLELMFSKNTPMILATAALFIAAVGGAQNSTFR